MVLRAVRVLPLFLVVCCWFRLNAAVPLAVHLRPPRQAREFVSEEKENVQEVGKDVVLRTRTRRDASPMDLSFRRHHESEEAAEEYPPGRRHHRRPRKKIMINNQNVNLQIQRNEEEEEAEEVEVAHPHRIQDHDRHQESVPEGTSEIRDIPVIPAVHGKEEQNCAGGKKEHERYSSSFIGNVSSTRRVNLEEDFDGVAKDLAGKKSSNVYMGEDITLCWIETMTVKEDQSFNPPKRIVIREYTISFENAATIPDRYLDCTKLPGEMRPHDPDVGKTAIFEIIDENTKVSKLVNFTAVSHIGDVLVWQHKRVKCGVGPVVTKHIVEWEEGGDHPKKRVEIKVSPKIHQFSVSSPGEPCATESTVIGTSTVSAVNDSKEEGFPETPVTILPPVVGSTERTPGTVVPPVGLPVSTEETSGEVSLEITEVSTVRPGEVVTDLPLGEVTVTTECTTGFTTLPSATTSEGSLETGTSFSTESAEFSTQEGEVSSTTETLLTTRVPLAEVTGLDVFDLTTDSTELGEESTTSSTGSAEESTTSSTGSAEESTTSSTGSAEESTTSSTGSAEESTTSSTGSAEESTTSSTGSAEESTTSSTGSAEESTTSSTGSAEESTTSSTGSAEESTTSSTGSAEESTTSSTGSAEDSTTSSTGSAEESTTSSTESAEESTTSSTESAEESTTSSTESAEESTTSSTESTEDLTTSTTELFEESTTSTTELLEESATSTTELLEESTTSTTELFEESTTSATESVDESSASTTESVDESTTSTTELIEESSMSTTESSEEWTTISTEPTEEWSTISTEPAEEWTTSSTESGESTISIINIGGISTISPTEYPGESTTEVSSFEPVSDTTEEFTSSTFEPWETSSYGPLEESSTETSTMFATESTESTETETFESSTEVSSTPIISGETISTGSSEYLETTTGSGELCPGDSSESCFVDSQETSTFTELSSTEITESSWTETSTTSEESSESTSVFESPESTTATTEGSSEGVSESSSIEPESTTASTVPGENIIILGEISTTKSPDITISGGLSASVSITGSSSGERNMGSTTTDSPLATMSSSGSCEDESGCLCESDGSCSPSSSAETSALSTIIDALSENLGLKKRTTAMPDSSMKKIFSKSSDRSQLPGMGSRISTSSGKVDSTGTALGMTTPTVPCDDSLGSCSQKGSLESCDGSENCTPTDSVEPCDSLSGSCSEDTNASVQGTTPTYGNIVFPATKIPESRESYNISTNIDNVPTTVETRRSTPLSAISTSPPDHKLILKIRVLLEHTNENHEKQNLVEVEKHLLLNENPKDRGHVDLLDQIRSLNKSVNMQAIKALLNCTSLGQLAEDTNQMVSSQLDRHVKPAGALNPSVYPSHAVPGHLNPPVNDFYHKPSIHSRHKDSDYEDAHRRKRRQIDTNDEEDIPLRERRDAQDDDENFGYPRSRRNRIAELPNATSDNRTLNGTDGVPRVDPVDSTKNFQITDSSEIAAIRESLPGMQEDVMAGLQHVFSELSAKDLQPADEKVAETVPKSKVLEVVADPKDKRLNHQRQRRSTIEEVGRWSNERIRRVPSGDKLRSFTEFTIYKDHS